MELSLHVTALRDEAKRLRGEADKLDEAADILDGKPRLRGSIPAHISRNDRRKRGRKNTRLHQLQKLLKESGPLFRREIIAQSNIPPGTVGMIMKPKNGFEKKEDGRWGLAAA